MNEESGRELRLLKKREQEYRNNIVSMQYDLSRKTDELSKDVVRFGILAPISLLLLFFAFEVDHESAAVAFTVLSIISIIVTVVFGYSIAFQVKSLKDSRLEKRIKESKRMLRITVGRRSLIQMREGKKHD